MKERPILFSAPMVRAILDGSKTQTRRAIRRPERFTNIRDCGFCCPHGVPGDRLWVRETFMYEPAEFEPSLSMTYAIRPAVITYRADIVGDVLRSGEPWSPSIHMPRRLSRITLEVTDVRVERLQEIGESDAIAEGARARQVVMGDARCGTRTVSQIGEHEGADARAAYELLWESINGAGSWDANPWVWVVSFRRITDQSNEGAKQ